MKPAIVLLFLAGFLGACNQQPSNDGPAPLPPGRALVAIKQQGAVTLSTRFDNLSSHDYLQCHNVNNVVQIRAQRHVDVPGTKADVRWLDFSFPFSKEIAQGTLVMWNDWPLEVFGKVTDKSMGGTRGTCTATLHIAGNVMTGSISCTGFESPQDQKGIGQFDFDITDLLCTFT